MKKVGFLIGIMVIFTALFVSCAGNGGNSDSFDFEDCTESVDSVELTDGTWNYQETYSAFTGGSNRTFIITTNGNDTTIQYTYYDSEDLTDHNSPSNNNYELSKYEFPPFISWPGTTYTIKANSSRTKYIVKIDEGDNITKAKLTKQ